MPEVCKVTTRLIYPCETHSRDSPASVKSVPSIVGKDANASRDLGRGNPVNFFLYQGLFSPAKESRARILSRCQLFNSFREERVIFSFFAIQSSNTHVFMGIFSFLSHVPYICRSRPVQSDYRRKMGSDEPVLPL